MHKINITVTYNTNDVQQYNCFTNIIHPELVTKIDCSYEDIKELPDTMNFPILTIFDCSNNCLTKLPNNMIMPKLQILHCEYNSLTELPNTLDLPELITLSCHDNELSTFPETMRLPKLQKLNCNDNRLETLPQCIISWPTIDVIYVAGNDKLVIAPELENLTNSRGKKIIIY